MASIDDDIDRLYQGPLEAFTDQRNALAKAARRPDVKSLPKPSVPAWAVNQLHWHHREQLDRLVAAAGAVREQHRRALAGEPADVARADQAHREAVRQTVTVAKEVLAAAGHPLTPATLDAVRETLQSLPSPDANGRLARPLAPQGMEALAGLLLASRPAAAPATPAHTAGASGDDAGTARQREAARFGEKGRAERTRQQERELAREREEQARAAREREARTAAAAAALTEARVTLTRAEAAVGEAERVLAERVAERQAARQALDLAERQQEE